LAFIFMFAASSLSCNLTAQNSAQPDLTLTLMSDAIVKTATAEASKGDQSLIDLATAEAAATATSAAIQATQTLRATTANETRAAEATVAGPILAELPYYNVDTTLGHVAEITSTQSLVVTGYQQTRFAIAPVTAADFVLATDLTWNTQYGSSGCGFMFRADGDRNKPNAYLILASRFANGRMVFTALVDGELANLRDFYPKDNDKSFQWENGTTNRIAIVARANIIEIYSNQAKVGEIDTTEPPQPIRLPPAPTEPLDKNNKQLMDQYLKQVEEYEDIIEQIQSQFSLAQANFENKPANFTNGFLGMAALSESGRTECTFSDTWLWIIDKE
jgi:hypothetical protein